jgi:hypothetical protein
VNDTNDTVDESLSGVDDGLGITLDCTMCDGTGTWTTTETFAANTPYPCTTCDGKGVQTLAQLKALRANAVDFYDRKIAELEAAGAT